MKTLIILLCLFSLSFAQYSGWLKYSTYTSSDQNDTTLTLQITNSVDYLTTSVRATGSADLPLQIDSTYWMINQADVAVTWANADDVNKYDGWRSIDTLLHGQSANGYVRIGLACLDTSGDTTAITQRRHYVSAFDETGPTILAYTATGVQYDSVQHVGSFTAESGAYYGIFIAQDTTETNLVGSWLSLVDFDTTLYHHVSQTTNQTFYLVATDNLDNVSWASDAATIEDTPDTTPPGAGTIVAEFLPNFQIGLTWNYADDADSVKVYLIEEDNPDSVLATTATTGTTGDTIDIPLTLKFAGNDNLYAKKYSWDASNNKSAAVVYTIPPSYFTMWVDTSDTNIDSLTYGIAYRYPGGINDSVANMQDSLTTDTTYIYHEDYANLDGSGDSLGLTFPDTNAIDTSWYAVRWNVDGVRQDTLSNWAMWPEAGSSTTYLVNQNFEGTGYDNGETWTESVQEGETSTRYVNEDYTTAPLAGSQSLEMRSDSYQVASVVTSLATASSSVSLSFKMNKTTGNPTDQVYFIEFLDASDNILSYCKISVNSYWQIQQTGGSVEYGSTAISQDTVTYVWVDHTASSGTDGVTSLYFGTSPTKPGTAHLSCTNGTATADVAKLKFQIARATIMIIDSVEIVNQ